MKEQKADARTRSGAINFKHIQTNISALLNSFYVKTIGDWNKLPRNVKTAPSTV